MSRFDFNEMSGLNVAGDCAVEIVGYLSWYSIGMKLLSRELLRKYLVISGVDNQFMPNEIRVSDAFRRATKAIECKRKGREGSLYEYKVEEIVSSKEKIQRHIVRKFIDSKNEELLFDTKEAILILNKEKNGSGILQVSMVNEEVQDLVQQATELFHLFQSAHDDNAIRAMCVSIIRSMSPVLVKASGGVYFVPAKYEMNLRAFTEFVNLLEGSEAQMIPLIKTKDTVNLVKNSTLKQLEDTFERLNQANDNDKLTAADITELIEKTELSFQIVEDYQEMFREELAAFSLVSLKQDFENLKKRKKDRKRS